MTKVSSKCDSYRFYAKMTVHKRYNRNMNKQHKKSDNKKTLLLIVPIVIILALLLIYADRVKIKEFVTKDKDTGLAVSSTGEANKKGINRVDYSPSSPSDNDTINNQKNAADQNTDKPVNSALNATITNTRVVNSLAQVSVLISGTTSGTCSLTMSKSGASNVLKSVLITIKGSITTCEDFNIPVSGLTAGNWTVNVVLISGQTKSNPAVSALQIGS